MCYKPSYYYCHLTTLLLIIQIRIITNYKIIIEIRGVGHTKILSHLQQIKLHTKSKIIKNMNKTPTLARATEVYNGNKVEEMYIE